MSKRLLEITVKTVFVLCMIVFVGSAYKSAYAADEIRPLLESDTYIADFDMDGAKEELEFLISDSHKLKVYFNGKIKKSIKISEYSWGHEIRVVDIDKSDKYIEFFVYSRKDSGELEHSALYRYQGGKVKKIWNGTKTAIISSDGKGIFYCYGNAYEAYNLVGTQSIKVKYQLKDGKVTKKSKNTFSFVEPIYTSDYFDGTSDGGLILRKNTRFYKDHDNKGKTFKVKSGTKAYPLKMYISDDNKVYVQYRIEKTNKKGWLCVDDWPENIWDEGSPFSNYFQAG